ncbi:hypothetical protein LRS10_06030 [Phenylobacterium sp. J426]|uniref:hypothetical protein n=1 Tax=Phenylobacterium sp. J426 TaxID=2898439 RepID=UPI002151C7AA|nr:hypothetical protein [Phenylobacterium sp. J426]MCR5873772.1 hypothetical protein [Phenylobacterium sp. J426]
MTTIRPNLPPSVPPQPQRAIDPARLAAQKAFFAAAMGQAPPAAPAALTPAAEPIPAARPAPATGGADGPQPARILRPGSVLDIRV